MRRKMYLAEFWRPSVIKILSQDWILNIYVCMWSAEQWQCYHWDYCNNIVFSLLSSDFYSVILKTAFYTHFAQEGTTVILSTSWTVSLQLCMTGFTVMLLVTILAYLQEEWDLPPEFHGEEMSCFGEMFFRGCAQMKAVVLAEIVTLEQIWLMLKTGSAVRSCLRDVGDWTVCRAPFYFVPSHFKRCCLVYRGLTDAACSSVKHCSSILTMISN